jgi:beta-galactosidase
MLEAMGYINSDFGVDIDRKALITLNRVKGSGALDSWLVYKLPLGADYMKSATGFKKKTYLVFGGQTFDLNEVGDTYFNLKNYGKGYVWVNGRNLGRFWNKSPQFKLFCPGVWLQNKGNELFVLELTSPQMKRITGDMTLQLSGMIIEE